MVEQLDRTAIHAVSPRQPHGHIRTAPWSIDREKPQPGRAQPKKVRVGMSHELVSLFGRTVQVEWVIDVIRGSKRRAPVGAINGRRQGIEEMPALRIPAALQEVEKANYIGFNVGMGL